jgi:hypothetical protein
MPVSSSPPVLYEVLPLLFKPHRLAGLTDRLLVSHYEKNSGGAVHRLNAMEAHLAGLDPSATVGFDLNAKRGPVTDRALQKRPSLFALCES